jgi:UDP-N-acetylglucosamine 2-epimerase (non-hydrolysing)
MMRIERAIIKLKPNIVLVPGDTNTTLAGALAAAKMTVPVGHIEAGARSYDMSMPEEINRRVTDHVSTMLFAPTEITERNLRAEGLPANRIFQVGDTMVDGLKAVLPLAKELKPHLLTQMDLDEREYVLTTAHRPANVDDQERLGRVVNALVRISKSLRVVFPAHPRIMHSLKSCGLDRKLKHSRNIILTKPLGYLEMIALLDAASAVLTDSGGLQKEAYLVGVPCSTMRNVTEWPETVNAGANKLVDADTQQIVNNVLNTRKTQTKRPFQSGNLFGSGRASKKIVNAILSGRSF